MLSKRVASSTSSVARCARRPIPRAGNVRVRSQQQAKRFQSTESTSNSSNAPAGGASPAVIGALTGSLATMSVGYLWYRQSGARDIVVASKTTKDYMKSAGKTIKDSTPEPNEALNWLRSTAKSYAMFIPGVGGYIDSAFDDLDAIREKHGQEVDDIVREAYTELQGLARNDQFSLLTAQKAWNIIVKHLGRIGDLAGDAMEQIMDNHPQLKDKVGPNIDTLKEYGRNYGPEAKKEVDRTWEQVSDVVKTGTGAENIKKIQDIVQEKVEKLKKLGDEAWRKGMEQAKPYLERNPEVRKLVEENADALKSGNVQELYRKIKKAVESGDTADIEAYVKNVAGKAKDSGFGGLEQYLGKVPGGDQIVPRLSQIGEVAQKHGDEAQKLLRDTVSEISEVLKKRGSEAEELANKAKENAK